MRPNRWTLAGALLALALLAWLRVARDASGPRASSRAGARVPAQEAGPAPFTEQAAADAAERMGTATPPVPAATEPVPHPAALVVSVLGSRGNPAAGAAVRIWRFQRSRSPGGAPLATQSTDGEGKARFEFASGGEVGIQVAGAGEVGTERMTFQGGPNEVVVRMERTLPVNGTVVDRGGEPVEGAEVLLSLAGPFAVAFCGFTDEDGHVPMPAWEVAARPYYQVTARGFRTAYGEFEKESLLRDGFEIRLEPLATVTGRFVDREGKGVVDVNVTVLETMQQTLSEPDGRFELPGLPDGGGTLVASPRTHGRLILRDVRPVRGGVDLGDIVLGAGLTISGRVTLPDGAPATAYVWASCGETGLAAGGAETDAEGRFVLRGLCPGPYLVTASDRFSHDPETGRTAEIADVAAGTENLDLALRCHPKLTIGLVSAETGGWAWVLKLEVRATLRGTARTVSQTLESPRKLRLKDTTLVLEAAGEYEVSVNTPGCPEQSLQVTLGPEEWKTVAVRLPRVE